MAAEMRLDMVRNNWVVIATDRAMRPHDFPVSRSGGPGIDSGQFCPFCEGNEAHTPREVTACRQDGGEANTPGWKVRIVPNKYSPFRLEGDLSCSELFTQSSCKTLGQHEVLVESPEHQAQLHRLPREHIKLILNMMRERYQALAADPRVKYIQIYKNRGLFAGASLAHSHSQILALPVVPRENQGISDYHRRTGSCLLCEMIAQEREEGLRVIREMDHFLLLCPYASRFSYESWVIPKRHTAHFGDLNREETDELAFIIRDYLSAVLDSLADPSYNIVINTAPVNVPTDSGYHWYMEVIPRLIVTAGVEYATGFYMNPVAPEIAADLFRRHLEQSGGQSEQTR